METLRLKGHIDSEGILKIAMPKELADSDADLVIVYSIQEKVQQEDWASFINSTYASLADDPLALPTSLNPEMRDVIE